MGNERGQVLPLVAIVIVLIGLLCVGLVHLGGTASAAARAQTAADAAALAGAAEGRERAEDLAEANGARLTRYEREGDEVEVTVQLGAHRVTARARVTRTTGPGPAR